MARWRSLRGPPNIPGLVREDVRAHVDLPSCVAEEGTDPPRPGTGVRGPICRFPHNAQNQVLRIGDWCVSQVFEIVVDWDAMPPALSKRALLVKHLRRGRNRALEIESWRKVRRLDCLSCGFDGGITYGKSRTRLLGGAPCRATSRLWRDRDKTR